MSIDSVVPVVVRHETNGDAAAVHVVPFKAVPWKPLSRSFVRYFVNKNRASEYDIVIHSAEPVINLALRDERKPTTYTA